MEVSLFRDTQLWSGSQQPGLSCLPDKEVDHQEQVYSIQFCWHSMILKMRTDEEEDELMFTYTVSEIICFLKNSGGSMDRSLFKDTQLASGSG